MSSTPHKSPSHKRASGAARVWHTACYVSRSGGAAPARPERAPWLSSRRFSTCSARWLERRGGRV